MPKPSHADARRGNCIEHLRTVIGVSAMVSVVGRPIRPATWRALGISFPWAVQFGHPQAPAPCSVPISEEGDA